MVEVFCLASGMGDKKPELGSTAPRRTRMHLRVSTGVPRPAPHTSRQVVRGSATKEFQSTQKGVFDLVLLMKEWLSKILM